MRKDRNKTLVACGGFALLVVCLATTFAQGQKEKEMVAAANVGTHLAAAPGESWPAKVSSEPEIKCTVVEWDPNVPMPKLTLLCPPGEVFAPLRVYIKFSWETPEQVPEEYRKIIAAPGTQTKMRSMRARALVWLKVQQEKEREPKARWMSFNYLVGLALQPDAFAQ